MRIHCRTCTCSGEERYHHCEHCVGVEDGCPEDGLGHYIPCNSLPGGGGCKRGSTIVKEGETP